MIPSTRAILGTLEMSFVIKRSDIIGMILLDEGYNSDCPVHIVC